MSYALLCSLYFDLNTSNVVFTHAMHRSVVFTRYDQCLPPPTIDGDAEGHWDVAQGYYVANAPDEIEVDFGFHEKGRIVPNAIEWSNGAVWTVPLGRTYRGVDENVTFTIDEMTHGRFLVRNGNATVGMMEQRCQEVLMPPRSGIIKGNMIAWNDGNIWWSASQLTNEDIGAWSYSGIRRI